MRIFKFNYSHLIIATLILSGLTQVAKANDIKLHYHCTADRSVNFANPKQGLGATADLSYSPEEGKNLNLIIGNQYDYILWIRQGYKETKRTVAIFKRGEQGIFQELSLGEEGESATAIFYFTIKENEIVIPGQCEIIAE